MPYCDSFCVLPRQRCACASTFPATYFQYFVPRFPHSFLFCHERKNSLNAKTFSNVRAQACLLRFIGLSVEKTAKKLEISECWAVKWSSSNEGLEDKKRRGKLIVLNKAAKIGLKKVRCKKKSPNEIALTIVSKPSLEQFHEKRRSAAPEMATKPLLSLPNAIRSSQICNEVHNR